MAAPSPAALSATEIPWHLSFIVGGLMRGMCGAVGMGLSSMFVLASSSFKLLGQCATTGGRASLSMHSRDSIGRRSIGAACEWVFIWVPAAPCVRPIQVKVWRREDGQSGRIGCRLSPAGGEEFEKGRRPKRRAQTQTAPSSRGCPLCLSVLMNRVCVNVVGAVNFFGNDGSLYIYSISIIYSKPKARNPSGDAIKSNRSPISIRCFSARALVAACGRVPIV